MISTFIILFAEVEKDVEKGYFSASKRSNNGTSHSLFPSMKSTTFRKSRQMFKISTDGGARNAFRESKGVFDIIDIFGW